MTLQMLQTVQNCSSTQIHDYLDASENSNQHSQTDGIYLLFLSPLSTNNLSLQHHVPPCLQCHDVPSSLSLSTPVPNCQANHHASGLSLQVTSQCKHPSSSTVPAHYRTSGVQHFIHVATKPRSLTKQTRPSRFSCQLLSVYGN